MPDPSIEELFQRYLTGQISAEDLGRLRQYIQDEKNNEILAELLEEAFTDKELSVTGHYKPEDVFNELMIRAGNRGIVPDKKIAGDRAFLFVGGWLKYATAAAVLGCIFISIYYFTGGQRARQLAKPVPAGNKKTEIAPGQDKAILTLANGQHIVLDSTAKGIISKQGGTRVINLQGQLTYNTENENGEALYNTVVTGRGNQYQLILPDGTKVWLNASSSLRFPTIFKGSERKVELTGEGYFAVTGDAKRAFIVAFNNTELQVLGTEFDIMAYSDEAATRTTLVKGSVLLHHESGRTFLQPGKMAVLTDGGVKVQAADIEQVTAWKNGSLSFDNTDFKTTMRQLSRWYDVDIRYAGRVPERRFGGLVSRHVQLSTVLDFLRSNGIHIQQEERVITILP